MGSLSNTRIDFAELDVQIIKELNEGKNSNVIELLENYIRETPWIGEKHLLLSRLLALFAIADSHEASREMPNVVKKLIDLVTSDDKRLLLKEVFAPLLSLTADSLSVSWGRIPDEFLKRIGAIPLYENSLEFVPSEATSEWVHIKGHFLPPARDAVETLVKRLVMNSLMAPQGTNIYDTVREHSSLLEDEILTKPEIIKNSSISTDGAFELEIRNIFEGDALITEIQRHIGKRSIIDEREASAIVGYRTDSNGSIYIEAVSESALGLPSQSLGNIEVLTSTIKDFQEKGLEVAHVHTHPSPTFFSFLDVSLDYIGDIDGDFLTYFSLNRIKNFSFSGFEELITPDKPLAGIVFTGYQKGFMYHPQKGTSLISLI